MATIEEFQGRVRQAIRDAVQKVLSEGDLPAAEAGEARFTTIETLALAAGDAVSQEVFELQLAESGLGTPHCPKCGFEGRRIKEQEREMLTRRGLKVPLKEQEYYCPGCRRAFFPAVQSTGVALSKGRATWSSWPNWNSPPSACAGAHRRRACCGT